MKRFWLIALLVACSGLFNVSRGQTPVAPEKAKNLHRLMELTGSHNLARQMIEGMMSSVKGNSQSANKELEAQVFRIFEEEILKVFTVERVEALVFPIYDKYFSDDEIVALIAFYESPLGKKTTGVLPQIMNESRAVGEILGREVQQNAMERIGNEVAPTAKTANPAASRRRTARPGRRR